MEMCIKDHGWMMNHQVMDSSLQLTEVSIKDSSKMGSSMERECFNGLMDQSIRGIGGKVR